MQQSKKIKEVIKNGEPRNYGERKGDRMDDGVGEKTEAKNRRLNVLDLFIFLPWYMYGDIVEVSPTLRVNTEE